MMSSTQRNSRERSHLDGSISCIGHLDLYAFSPDVNGNRRVLLQHDGSGQIFPCHDLVAVGEETRVGDWKERSVESQREVTMRRGDRIVSANSSAEGWQPLGDAARSPDSHCHKEYTIKERSLDLNIVQQSRNRLQATDKISKWGRVAEE